MDNSSDSSSDSDSNSSTSWVFVEDTTIQSPKTANTFHLDCSREPIQELTEQDLLSAGSDFESDTDGISVISESEVPIDDLCLNIQTSSCNNDSVALLGKTNIGDDDDTNIVYNDSEETTAKEAQLVREPNEKLTKIIKPLHMLGIGFVLTAVFLACYSRITTKISKENVDFDNVDHVLLYDKIKIDDVASFNKIDLTYCDNSKKLYDAKTNLNKDLEEIVDITMTCAFRHKPKNDILDKQIKKCVKKEYNTKKMGSSQNTESMYSEMLESIEHYKKVIEIKSEDILGNTNEPKTKNVDDGFREHIKLRYNKKKNEKTNYNNNDDTVCNIESENRANHEKKEKVEEFTRSRKEKIIKHKCNKKKQNLVEQFKNDYKSNAYFESDAPQSKNQIPAKKHYSKYQKDKKHYYKDKKQYDYKNKKQYYQYKDKKYHYVDKKKYEFKHNNKNFDKHQKNIEVIIKHKNENKENKFKDISNKNAKSRDPKYRDKITPQKRNNTTGEWYTNLHKARNQLRKQEHVSDWVFDRAHIRNKKRNKAQWYFKWMNVREQLRYKQSYKPYSS